MWKKPVPCAIPGGLPSRLGHERGRAAGGIPAGFKIYAGAGAGLLSHAFDNLHMHVPVNPHEKAMQRALIQYRNPKNYELVEEALKIAGRTDLIGYDKKCLIRPRKSASKQSKPQRDKPVKKKKTIRNVHKKKR